MKTRTGTTRKMLYQEIIIFWAMFVLTMLHEWIFINSLENFLKGFVFFLILYIQAQIHRFFIFNFYLGKRYIMYFFSSFAVILIGSAVLFTANLFWIQPEFFDADEFLFNFLYHFVICIISTVTIMALSLMQRYAIELQHRNRDQLLLNEMNLKFLHTQLNPHFFFNMLNNLYGVSLTEPGRTPGLIVKLSEMMRYQIENGNVAKVSLTDEIEFIRNYTDMERERIGKRSDIIFNFSESAEDISLYSISPLLLITLVENSFKHSQNNSNWFVHINIAITDDSLHLKIENSLADKNLQKPSTKVGLNNLRQRLAYLYGDRFTFHENRSELSYSTTLNIPLEKTLL
ncbi:histidine kinase [Chryseobacterium sp. Ch-15]|uniref:Histidine kinase n=1 Tax=Chryseobacterium muglaense TaxID=2893752 RepID=A0A9Q3UW49_9FLAO|nr:histidine kinase [Chryseobacterium muglaense]MBD3906466.1 histidine kinase [Chryseobacterium muglaense]MCC9036823.1 histidine kinase [Chryseobacterium muglaense]MCM2556149.1 histidine kinase [Chryseobacterium muglaense]